MRELRELAGEMGVTVSSRSPVTMDGLTEGLQGLYLNASDLVVFRRGMPAVRQLVVLAHELGHAVEWHSLGKKVRSAHDALYSALKLYMDQEWRLPDELYEFMVEREVVAWDNGDELLAELDVRLPPSEVRRLRRNGLMSWKRILRAHRKSPD